MSDPSRVDSILERHAGPQARPSSRHERSHPDPERQRAAWGWGPAGALSRGMTEARAAVATAAASSPVQPPRLEATRPRWPAPSSGRRHPAHLRQFEGRDRWVVAAMRWDPDAAARRARLDPDDRLDLPVVHGLEGHPASATSAGVGFRNYCEIFTVFERTFPGADQQRPSCSFSSSSARRRSASCWPTCLTGIFGRRVLPGHLLHPGRALPRGRRLHVEERDLLDRQGLATRCSADG